SLFSIFFFSFRFHLRSLPSFPTRRSSDLIFDRLADLFPEEYKALVAGEDPPGADASGKGSGRTPGSISRPEAPAPRVTRPATARSEEHTSELQSRSDLVCRLLLEKKKKKT